MLKKHMFPKDFLWGASTSSHQVEGNTLNQWTIWEKANAERMAKTAPERHVSQTLKHKDLPNWQKIKSRITDPENYISGSGIDHYSKYEADFDLAKKINLNAFRFSIEWSRIEPQPGLWEEREIEHYRSYIKALKKRGLEPVLNVWHWTHPTWFEGVGGFAKRSNLKYFERFCKKLAEEYSEDIKYVITVNEPNVFTTYGYLLGTFPPAVKKPLQAAMVYINLVEAHKICYKAFKKVKPGLQIGLATQLANIQAKRPHHLVDQAITKIMRYAWNWWFLNRVDKYQDFIGFNYYFTDYYKLFGIRSPKVPISDVGWYMEPEGLYPILVRAWAHYKKPVIVTENGVADEYDQYRQWWLEETSIAMERAISEGVDVIGYFHWSLLDNFEWEKGWWPKFGLVSVDRTNKNKRELRVSAYWLAERIEELRKV